VDHDGVIKYCILYSSSSVNMKDHSIYTSNMCIIILAIHNAKNRLILINPLKSISERGEGVNKKFFIVINFLLHYLIVTGSG